MHDAPARIQCGNARMAHNKLLLIIVKGGLSIRLRRLRCFLSLPLRYRQSSHRDIQLSQAHPSGVSREWKIEHGSPGEERDEHMHMHLLATIVRVDIGLHEFTLSLTFLCSSSISGPGPIQISG